MKTGRPPTSPHGKLFGGDSLYEVLATLAANRGKRFSVLPMEDADVVPLARTIGRAVTQTRREVRKLKAVGLLEEIERRRKAEVYAVSKSKLSDQVLSLPDLLVERLGPYRSEGAGERAARS
jgi:hypothetical protein